MSSASVTALSFSCFSSSNSLLFCSFICASNAILSCCCCSTIFFCFFISTHFCLSSCNVVVNDNVSRSFSSACIVRVPFNRSNCSTLCLLAFNCNVNAWTFFWCSWVKCFLVFELVETKNKTKTKNQPKKQNTKNKKQLFLFENLLFHGQIVFGIIQRIQFFCHMKNFVLFLFCFLLQSMQ